MIESLLARLRGLGGGGFGIGGPGSSAANNQNLPRFTSVLLGLLTLVTLLLTWVQWSTIYASAGAFPPIIIAGVVAVFGGLLVTTRTSSTARSIPLSALLLVLGCAAWYGAKSGNLLGDLVGSWKSLASTGLLVPVTQEFVLVPVVTTWMSGWIAVELIIRRTPVASLILPIAGAHAVSLSYTISQHEPSWWLIALVGLLIFAILGIAAADHHPDHAATGGSLVETDTTAAIRWRQALVALPFAALVSLVGLGFDRLVSNGSNDQFDLRERLVRPLDVFETTSPLSRVKAGLVDPSPNEVFTILVDGLSTEATIEQIPVATLDLYDGALWTSSARFEAAGATLPVPDQPQLLDGTQLVQSVQIETDYPFHFLPRVGQVARSDSPQLGWDPRSGSIANLRTSGQSFTYITQVRPSDDENIPVDELLRQPLDRLKYATAVPDLNPDQGAVFAALLERITDGAATDYEALLQLEAFLTSEEFSYNPDAPAGHSLAALTSYLAPTEAGDAKIGFTEQSVATFALAARQLGIPSRIIVGYQLDEPLTWDNNRQVITEDMIHAWPEVWFNNAGWVAFEPTNSANETSEQTSRTPAIGDNAAAGQAGDLPELQAPILIPDPPVPGVARRRLIILGAVLSLPLLFFAAVLLAKGLRRSKRQRGDAAHRISGAWLETRERLDAYGLPSSRSATVIEIAEQLNEQGHMKIAVPLAKMAPTVTAALYAPEDPSDADADAMWQESTAVRKEASQVVPFSRRLRAAADPRVLVRK